MPNKDNTTNIEWLKKGLEDLTGEMRSGFKSINDRLDLYEARFETQKNAQRSRDLIWEKIKEIENKRLKEIMDTKADKDDVDDIKKLQDKVTWLVLSTVILAVIGVVITKVSF